MAKVKLSYGVHTLPLSKPYKLSFVTLTEISSVWVRAETGHGAVGWGEGVPLFGYSDETLEIVYAEVEHLVDSIQGLDESDAWGLINSADTVSAIALSAVATALDMTVVVFPEKIRFPLVVPLSTDDEPEVLLAACRQGLQAGFKHFKVKVGRNVQKDIAARKILEKVDFFPSGVSLRYDANQAYSEDEALDFCNAASAKSNVFWLEQPLHRDDWDGMARLCSLTDFPLMLDESIYTEGHVRRAQEMGCAAIKLKLAKHPGVNACIRLARLANEIGLKVIMGNGVSSDIGNVAEAQVVHQCADIMCLGAECNGFNKLLEHMIYQNLRVDRGDLVFSRECVVVEQPFPSLFEG